MILNMQKYENEGLNIIAEKYTDIDFSDVDGKIVVRVGAICKKLGIDINLTILPNGHAGYYDHQTNTIMVNDAQPATQNLFTIAHELGHYILHQGTNNRYQNDFAMKLLMPEKQFIESFRKNNGILRDIAYEFGVSVQICEVRAFNIGLVTNL